VASLEKMIDSGGVTVAMKFERIEDDINSSLAREPVLSNLESATTAIWVVFDGSI